MFLVELILIWCVIFALWWYKRPRHPSPPVYPGALPVIGHAHQFLGDISQIWQVENDIYHFCMENGGLVEVRLGPVSVYVVSDLDDSLTIANTCMEKPYLYGFGKKMYGCGLVTANASTWKPHRKILNPAFNQQILNTFFQEYSLQARNLVTELATEAEKDAFDVVPYLKKTVIRSVYKTMIGVNPNDKEQEAILKNYAHATDTFFSLMLERFQSVWLHLPLLYNMSGLKKKQDAVIETLKNLSKKITTIRKLELKQNINSEYVKEASSGYKSLLDQLLDGGEKQVFTDEEIREHLNTVIGAAYDTSTMTTTFCLILIGSYPDVQARIWKELQEVLDGQERDLTRHDLPKLVYLEAVIKETLRLYPPVPRIGRCNDSEVQLKHYTFPAGTTFILSLYGMNRDPIWGKDANEFNPDRWLNPGTLPDNPNAFAAFSIGKRNCIGKQSAMMSVKTTLAYILQKYIVTGDIRNVQCKCDLIHKPVSGHYIALQLRT
ncbi:hypothetical protein PYW08_009646 [Mythimna loreyi]|uniref:Uncharacterized protein n=1 Tax=Mythimna loreyi TaxID=667449 RepID=A0ACC2Q6N0_9NEOP|nr:hypothetical protein PYW08_009646 [Mythimna loreyi]